MDRRISFPTSWRVAIFLAVFVALSACVVVLNATIPDGGYHVVPDMAYGKLPRQKLDIYVPDGQKTAAPVLVFYYGGSWQSGSKEDYKFVGEAFASLGYVTVIADYRLYPEVHFPTFVDDAARALVWVHTHIAAHGGDAKNVFVSGHSAGAYNAVMLSVNPAYLSRAGGDGSYIRGALGIAGPYDFLPITDDTIGAIFSKAKPSETQPITFATHKKLPMLLATGNVDEVVDMKNTLNLANALRGHGTEVVVKRYDGIDHVGIVLSLASGFRGQATLREDMDAFMKEHRTTEKPAK